MIRQRVVAVAAAVVASLATMPTVLAEQEPPRKLIAPVRGEATIEMTAPNTKPVGGEIVTVITVKNTSTGAIAGFKVEENWYDKGGNAIGGDTYRHPRPLPPNEVITITLKTPRNPAMQRNQYQFTHANGNIKPKTVPKLEAAKPGA